MTTSTKAHLKSCAIEFARAFATVGLVIAVAPKIGLSARKEVA